MINTWWRIARSRTCMQKNVKSHIITSVTQCDRSGMICLDSVCLRAWRFTTIGQSRISFRVINMWHTVCWHEDGSRMSDRRKMMDASCQHQCDCTGFYRTLWVWYYNTHLCRICRVVRQLPCCDIYGLHNVIQLHNRKRESDMVNAVCITLK